MSMSGSPHGSVTTSVATGRAVTPPPTEAAPQQVHNCRRLGLQASPQTFRLGFGWFRRR